MKSHRFVLFTVLLCGAALFGGCSSPDGAAAAGGSPVATPWLGIPSAVNYVVNALHDGTGWLLNKSQVAIKKVGDVRPSTSTDAEWLGDFQITVAFGNESFETTAKDVPCDQDGIPTEASVERLRSSVEEIKVKMKRLQL